MELSLERFESQLQSEITASPVTFISSVLLDENLIVSVSRCGLIVVSTAQSTIRHQLIDATIVAALALNSSAVVATEHEILMFSTEELCQSSRLPKPTQIIAVSRGVSCVSLTSKDLLVGRPDGSVAIFSLNAIANGSFAPSAQLSQLINARSSFRACSSVCELKTADNSLIIAACQDGMVIIWGLLALSKSFF